MKNKCRKVNADTEQQECESSHKCISPFPYCRKVRQIHDCNFDFLGEQCWLGIQKLRRSESKAENKRVWTKLNVSTILAFHPSPHHPYKKK